MATNWDHGGGLLWGPLLDAVGSLPLHVRALLCDLRPRFLPKGRAGRGYRAIARNGRVLLASEIPLPDLAGREARLRLQVWHRTILPGDDPEPYGLLLCVDLTARPRPDPCYCLRLVDRGGEQGDLILEVGGGLVLEFRRTESGDLKTATSK